MVSKSTFMCTTLLASAVLSVGAQAQEASGTPTQANEETGIADILVTARRFEESVQTTPVAVTAIEQRTLERQQVIDVTSIQRIAPGLVVRQGTPGPSSTVQLGIRGQNNLAALMQNDQAVGIYLDGVYIPRSQGALMDFVDMQRVEVLRGPQGTLFGRNTTGGALNMVTNDPVDRWEGKISGELGNYDYRNAQVTLNAPLAEGVAARITYNFRERGGYVRNVTLGRDIADVNSHFVRGKLRFERNNFNIIVSGDYSRTSDNGSASSLAAYDPKFATYGALFGPNAYSTLEDSLHRPANWWRSFSGGLVSPSSNPLFAQISPEARRLYDEKPNNRGEGYGFSTTMNLDLDAIRIKSISGYRYNKSRTLIDTDGSPLPLLATFSGQLTKQYSQELQISGDISERISFITGAYISRETGYDVSQSQLLAGLIRENFATSKNISKGLFAQAYYKLTDQLRLAGGFRYTWDTRSVDIRNKQVAGLASDFIIATTPTVRYNCNNANVSTAPTPAEVAARAAECSQPQSADFSYPAWTFGIDWQASDQIFLYAKTSGAARAGGWNVRAGSLPAFSPEKVKDAELGIKTDLFDRRVRLNAAFFNTWKSGIHAQTNVVTPGIGSTAYTTNNGDARIWGAEFELVVAPWSGMEILSSLALMDGKYKKGTYLDTQRVTGFSGALPPGCVQAAGLPATTVDCTVDFGGNSLIQLPKRQFNLGATQTVHLGAGQLSFHADYSYISSQRYFTVVPAAAQPPSVQAVMTRQNQLAIAPGYSLVNARIGYELKEPGLEFYVFVSNLTNNKNTASRFADLYRDLGFVADFPGLPRMWGIGAKWKFGR